MTLLEEPKTSYAFRHAFIDQLRDANVPEGVRMALTGPARQVIEDGYGLGYSLQKKASAIKAACAWLEV